MKKFLLVLFILLDLVAMTGAAFIIYSSVTGKKHGLKTMLPTMNGMRLPASMTPKLPAPKAGAPGTQTTGISTAAVSTPVAAAPLTPSTPYRNILFTYKNVKAKQVLIRADFTGWKGVPMKRDPTGLWSYPAQLVPGEYAYCFTVDDKIIKDPGSKHTKRIAQTLVSAITVTAAKAP